MLSDRYVTLIALLTSSAFSFRRKMAQIIRFYLAVNLLHSLSKLVRFFWISCTIHLSLLGTALPVTICIDSAISLALGHVSCLSLCIKANVDVDAVVEHTTVLVPI